MSRHSPRKNLQGRRKKKAPPAPAAAPEVLDIKIGRLRVRCADAVALDNENCLLLVEPDGGPLQPGDLLIEERDADGDWAGGVVVRQADRAELVAVLFAGPAPAGGGA